MSSWNLNNKLIEKGGTYTFFDLNNDDVNPLFNVCFNPTMCDLKLDKPL